MAIPPLLSTEPLATALGPQSSNGWAEAVPAVRARILGSLQQSSRGQAHQLAFQAMGTRCAVTIAAPAAQLPSLTASLLEWVASFEAKYSRFLPTSLISTINRAAGQSWVAIDPETEQLFRLCDHLHFVTGGVFDPTSLPLIQTWNWKSGILPSPDTVAKARQLVGWRRVQRAAGQVKLPEPGMGLDLGGMGKEYAVDCVAQLLAGVGVAGALVDFGADVRVVGLPSDGRPGWHIGLDDPRQPGRCWCGLGLREGAVATSGDYIRRFVSGGRSYGHILDVRTGSPVDNGCRAASVVAPSCILAGMLSTALFVLGTDEGMRLLEAQFGAAGAILTDNGPVTSRRFYEYVVS